MIGTDSQLSHDVRGFSHLAGFGCVRFALRVDFNNLPFKQPQFAQPNAVFNANSPLTFGRFTSVRGGTSGVGTSTPHIIVGGRVQI